jgi:hypothetical protein
MVAHARHSVHGDGGGGSVDVRLQRDLLSVGAGSRNQTLSFLAPVLSTDVFRRLTVCERRRVSSELGFLVVQQAARGKSALQIVC